MPTSSSNKFGNIKRFALISLIFFISGIAIFSIKTSRTINSSATESTSCISKIDIKLTDTAGRTINPQSTIKWTLDKKPINSTGAKSKNFNIEYQSQKNTTQKMLSILDDNLQLMVASLDDKQMSISNNSIMLDSFCGEKTLMIIAKKLSPKANSLAGSQSTKIPSCNQTCLSNADSCSTGYECVPNCVPSLKTKCPDAFIGRCRASACLLDPNCACAPTPTPSFKHGVHVKLKFTGGAEFGRYFFSLYKQEGTENYRGLELTQISQTTTEFDFNPHVDGLSDDWYDFTVYADKQYRNSDYRETGALPKGTKITYGPGCKANSKPDECNLHLEKDGGVINLEINVDFPPIDFTKTGKLQILGIYNQLPQDAKTIKYKACRLDPLDLKKCLPNPADNFEIFGNNLSGAFQAPMREVPPGKYLIEADTNFYKSPEDSTPDEMPDQTAINANVKFCDEFDNDPRHCYLWIRDGATRVVTYDYFFPTSSPGIIRMHIGINGIKPTSGLVGDITVCKWSLKNTIGDCLANFQTPIFRAYSDRYMNIPDLTVGRYIVKLNDYYYEEDEGNISTKKVTFPKGTEIGGSKGVFGNPQIPPNSFLYDVTSASQDVRVMSLWVQFPNLGEYIFTEYQFDSRIEIQKYEWGLQFEACPIISGKVDCTKKYTAHSEIKGLLDNVPFFPTLNKIFEGLVKGEYLVTLKKGLYDPDGRLFDNPYMRIKLENCDRPMEDGCIVKTNQTDPRSIRDPVGPKFLISFKEPSSIKGQLKIRNQTGQNFEVNDVDFNLCRNDRNNKECFLAKSIPANKLTLKKISSTSWTVDFDLSQGQSGPITTNTNYGIQSLIKISSNATPISFFHQYAQAPSENLNIVANLTDVSLNPAKKITKKILLIKQNPKLPSQENKRMQEIFFPAINMDKLSSDAVEIVNNSSKVAKYQIEKSLDYDHLPPTVKVAFETTQEQDYIACAQAISDRNPACKRLESRKVDYIALFSELKICEMVNQSTNRIDEVWMVALPYTGIGEGDMVGPNPYNINGNVVKNTACKHNVPVLALDLTRPPELAIHSLGHRMEFTMSLIYHSYSWDTTDRNNNWEKFVQGISTKNVDRFGSHYACGSIHFPPNTKKEYNYLDSNIVPSYCKSFFDYPIIDNTNKEEINYNSWGSNETGYYQWWFSHIPTASGRGADGVLQNWWTYFIDPDFTAKEAGVKALDAFNNASSKNVHTHHENKSAN